MNFNTIRGMSPVSHVGGMANPEAAKQVQSKEPGAIFGGKDVTISFTERNVLDGLQKTEDAEEPARGDTLSNLIRDVYKDYTPPPAPDFV